LSLKDIVEKFALSSIVTVVSLLMELEGTLRFARRNRKDETPIDNEDLKAFITQLDGALMVCKSANLECLEIIKEAAGRFKKPNVTLGVMEIKHVQAGINRELEKWQFVPIRPDLVPFFEKDDLFGWEVFDKFEDARRDIKEAGNCIAVGLPTSAVFHLMRVAEYGLRKIARSLRVTLTHRGKNQPIEFADWDKIITGCNNQIAKARSLASGAKRQAKLELFSDAAQHCLFMKDIWRNSASHTRSPYNQPEAVSAFDRVRVFMVFLATKIL
jgi:hypothetical protein